MKKHDKLSIQSIDKLNYFIREIKDLHSLENIMMYFFQENDIIGTSKANFQVLNELIIQKLKDLINEIELFVKDIEKERRN